MKLSEIYSYEKYPTDKGTDHSYIEVYDELFEPYQNKQINFLEIGFLLGSSLVLFNDYFENANITGIDNWSEVLVNFDDGSQINLIDVCTAFKLYHPDIQVITCDSTDVYDVNLKINQTYDIIIDDGKHTQDAQFETFKNFIPKLNKDGIYIIEDVAHYNVFALFHRIQKHIKKYSISISIEVKELYKGDRWDDILFIIRRTR